MSAWEESVQDTSPLDEPGASQQRSDARRPRPRVRSAGARVAEEKPRRRRSAEKPHERAEKPREREEKPRERAEKSRGRAEKPREREEKSRGRAEKPRRSGGSRSLLATRMGASAELPAPRRKRRRPSRQRLALLFSCHGGSGSTTLATSMGAMLARSGKRTCIVDLDLQFGDVLTALNLKGRCPISDVLEDLKAAGRQGLDRDHLWSRLPRYGSRLWVLSQVGCVEGLAGIAPDRLPRLLRAVRRCFDVTIVDGIRDFSDLALAALDVSDSVLMVATQDVPTLRGLALRSDIFQRLGYEPEELGIVLNRYSERGVVPLAAISDSLDVEPSFLVSNDFRTVHRAINDGEPLSDSAPRARVTRDIAVMVEQLYGIEMAGAGERQGLLQRILGGRG